MVVHLIASAVAERRRRTCSLSERAVERRSVLYSIGHDRRIGKTVCVQSLSDSSYSSVHHIRRSDHVGTCQSLRNCRFAQKLECAVIVNVVVPAALADESAVAVRSVLAEAYISDDVHLRILLLDVSDGSLDDAVLCISLASDLVLVIRNTEQHDAVYACLEHLFDLGVDHIHSISVLTRKSFDLIRFACAVHNEHRVNQR